MSFAKRLMATLMVALLLALPCAEVLAEVSQRGGFSAEGNGQVYIVLPENAAYSLYTVPSTGGDMRLLESCPVLEDLVFIGQDLFYVRVNNGKYQIVRYDAAGIAAVLTEFATTDGETVSRMTYYDGVLYCLVGDKPYIVDPSTGEQAKLCDTPMSDFAISEDVFYYVSATDKKTYVDEAPGGTGNLTVSAGRLYSMSIQGTNPELVLDAGISDLKASGQYLYFHNYEDRYNMGSGADVWQMGKLYVYNIASGELTSMGLGYDWDYNVTPNGVVVYTQQDISIYPLAGGTPVSLMQPEIYTMLYAVGDNVFVYEQTKKVLTKLPANGSQAIQLVGGAKLVDDNGAVIDDTLIAELSATDEIVDDFGEEAVTVTATKKPVKSTGTDGSYIFKYSHKKKLTRSQILDVSKSKWAYARNEIYARHGYAFKTKKYADYFSKKSWYKKGGFSTSDINSIEWYNMELLKQMEDEYGVGSGSGSGGSGGSGGGSDGSYLISNSGTTRLTESDVKKLDRSMWAYARNEIYARHGYAFKTKKFADYFSKKSWYKKGGFSTGDLSQIEWDNMALIKKMEGN